MPVASRYADAVSVKKLRQKLELLYQSGRVDGDAALARLFKTKNKPNGLTGRTIRQWVQGDGLRDANKIPAHQFGRFVEIFQQRLPGNRTQAETRALLVSPNVSDLAQAFRASVPRIDWISLVLKAEPGGMAIVLWDRPTDFRTTARRKVLKGLNGSVECPVNQFFRLKLLSDDPGWVLGLQWGQSGWFGLELNDDSISLESSDHAGIFPTQPPYYFETEPGVRRYIFIRTLVPLPPDLLSKVSLSTRGGVPLDVSTLDRFAHVASEMSDFHMNVLDVNFTKRNLLRNEKL